jgi:hypothetical protein
LFQYPIINTWPATMADDGILVNKELRSVLKEAGLVRYKIPPKNMFGITEENNETVSCCRSPEIKLSRH